MAALLTSPYNIISTAAEYRPMRLHCRFVIAPGACHRTLPADMVPRCEHLDRAMYAAGCMFLEDMIRQGWEPQGGTLKLTGGPIPEVVVGTANLPGPIPHRKLAPGPHARFGPAYDSPIEQPSDLDTTDAWQYVLSGWFVRKLLPTVMTVDAAARLEARRAARRRVQRGR